MMDKPPLSSTQPAHPTEKQYLTIFGALILLTLLTVGLSYVKLPSQALASLCGLSGTTASTLLAMMIAVIKACLVASVFMNLRYEKRFLLGIFLFAILLAFFFMIGTAPDIAFHHHI